MATLFEEGSSDEDGNLKINKSYAENYNQWREKEEYQKLKDKYGEGAALELVEEADDNTSSESEDEGDGWNSDVEKQFFQTLASLKTKDPSIYDSKQKFFEQQPDFSKPTSKSKTEEKVTLRDYERKLILEKGGKFSDDEDIHPLTFTEEQNQLKKGFKKILDHCDDDDGDLLVKRETNSSEKVREDEEYKEWLKGQKKDITNEEMKVKLKPLKDYWSDPNLDENEKFLKDFFLNKRYKDPEDKNRIPSYDEIVHDSEGDLSEDEKTLEKQRDFELKYNFRFEEPDPEFIKRYPRTIAGSMRKPDTSRKEKRDEIKERKKREKEEKKEELKQLKKYKLKEIQEKLEQLKTITGNQSLPFQDDELDQDFDPESHDRKMGEMFNDEYYHIDESDQKPEFPYDPEIDDENWDEYTGQEGDEEPSTSSKHLGDEPHCEDPDFIMDCDYDANAENTTDELSRRGRRRKKSLFAKKLEKKKPVFDPQQHPNYEEYLEEYYKLDYEDIIGDQPVRFKYRNVVPNSFGLDTEEILVARDKELNQWCSIKKMSQYRTEGEELQDVRTFKSKRQNQNLIKRVIPSLFVENPEDLLVEDQEAARQKRKRIADKGEQPQINEKDHEADQEVVKPLLKKKRKNKGKDEIVMNDQKDIDSKEAVNLDGPKETEIVSEPSKKKRKAILAVESSSEIVDPSSKCTSMDSMVGSKRTQTNLTTGNTAKDSDKNGSLVKSNKKNKKNKKKRKAKKNSGVAASSSVAIPPKINQRPIRVQGLEVTDDRLKAYGLNPKKFKNSIKYGKSNQ